MTAVYDCCLWLLSITAVYDGCLWLLSMTAVYDCCLWLPSMTAVYDCRLWLLSMTAVYDCVSKGTFISVIARLAFTSLVYRWSTLEWHSAFLKAVGPPHHSNSCLLDGECQGMISLDVSVILLCWHSGDKWAWFWIMEFIAFVYVHFTLCQGWNMRPGEWTEHASCRLSFSSTVGPSRRNHGDCI